MSNNKNVKFINFEKLIDVLTEHRNKLKAYSDYISELSDMAMLALDDESILANTKIEFRVKKQIEKGKKRSNPRDLLDLLTNSGTPDEFARNLDSIQDKIEENRDKEKKWENLSIKMDGLDNITFLAVLSGIIEVLKKYKKNINQKTENICKKL
tara:strand:+ start:1452 stop:1913 length:462 start_codon:yes stop_codon:yes gene_type:complete